MSNLEIAVVIGSTRPGRVGPTVAAWVAEQAQGRTGANYTLVDVADFNLPLLDEPYPAGMNQYQHDHTKAWAAEIAKYDGFVFVTPEYNHAPGAALKNALDFLGKEWNNKAAALVGYGSVGGARAVEHLRLILGELQIADVRTALHFTFAGDFENYSVFKPSVGHDASAQTMFDQLETWAAALREVRQSN